MLARLRELWTGMPAGRRRVVLIGGPAFLVVVVASAAVFRGQGTMVTLYAGLDATESREIAAELSRMSVPARLSPDEATISVPAVQEATARMRLASLGLPHSSPPGDWDLFDRTGLAVTQSQQEAMKIRALQGSLARSIASLESVQKAAVHISLPERSPFLDDAKPAKAAVLLHLKSGQQLGRSQAQSIAFLVSHSVPDLGPENVTILDEKGTLLFSDNVALGSGAEGGPGSTETALRREVQSLLDDTFGLGKTLVRAHVDLETDRVETVAVQYQPAADGTDTGLVNKETVSTETANGTPRAGTAGEPGTAANLFGSGAAATRGVGTYNRTSNERSFDNPRTETVTVKPPGGVKRISLGIFIDESLAEQQTKIEAVARAAAGIQADRGDTVSVESVKFASTEVAPLVSAGRFEMVKTIVRWVLNSLAFLIGALLLRSLIATLRVAPSAPSVFATPDGRLAVESTNGELKLLTDQQALGELRQEYGEQLPALPQLNGGAASAAAAAAPAGDGASKVLEELMAQVQSSPVDDIAEVVRHWLEGELDG